MPTLYVKCGWVPLCGLLALSGCATPNSHGDEAPAWSATDDPGATVAAFTAAWNAGKRGGVLATFEETRRGTIDSASVFDDRLRAWKATHHAVLDQCNARGAFFKTAIVSFVDRRSGASIEEIVWIHLHDGRWWMYSL